MAQRRYMRAPASAADVGPSRADRAVPALQPTTVKGWAVVAVGGAAVIWVAATPMSSALPALVLALFAAVLWRGASVIVAAPVFALILAAFLEGPRALVFFEHNFASSAGNFVARYFLIFLLGAILGRVLVESGCAAGVARRFWRGGAPWRAPLAVAAACALMTLGGVGVFVIAFAMQPIAREIYARARLPLALAPAAIALGAFTATMTAIPGAPSLTNIIAATMVTGRSRPVRRPSGRRLGRPSMSRGGVRRDGADHGCGCARGCRRGRLPD
jgi:hypothetical protein